MHIADKIDNERIQACLVDKKDEIENDQTRCFTRYGNTLISYENPGYVAVICHYTSINNICR
jgi:hypothetical protein